MSFPKYESYKHSSAEWMRQIPSYWEIKQLRHICTCEDGKRIPLNAEERSGRQGEYPYWGANGIVDHVDEWLFDEELVLLGEDGAPFFEDNKTVSFLSQGKIWPNNHIHVLRPKEPGSGAYISHSLNAVDYSSAITGSTRDKLNQGAMNGIKLPWPPVNERKLIAIFLDCETAKIDTRIAEQQCLIELLQEKRQAVISHAVTKGLNPNVPMKDSGVEWLGEVPEHWDVLPCRAFLNERDSRNGDYSNDYYLSLVAGRGVIPYDEKGDIGNKKPEDLGKCKLVHKGDFVINSMNYGIGSYGVSAYYGVCSPVYIVVTPNEDLAHAGFAFRVLENKWFQRYAQSFGNGILAHRCAISWDILKNINAGIPPAEEQMKILSYLDEGTRRYEQLTNTALEQVSLLQERRSALISATVTGQIDVRGLATKEEP